MTSSDRRVTTAEGLDVRVNVDDVRDAVVGMPKVAYFWLRDYFFQAFLSHRRTWLASKKTRFGRARAGGYGIRVSNIETQDGAAAPNEVRYQVTPAARRASSARDAARMLDQLSAIAATGNEILPVHEFGEDIRSADNMAIPVKTRPGSMRDWIARNPRKKLLFAPSKQDGKTLVYERIRRGRRGRPRKGQPQQRAPERLRLRWILLKQVKMRRTLNFYDSWDSLAQQRDQLWSRAASRIQRDFQRKDPRDF